LGKRKSEKLIIKAKDDVLRRLHSIKIYYRGGGGGGNRTRVRKSFSKNFYKLSWLGTSLPHLTSQPDGLEGGLNA